MKNLRILVNKRHMYIRICWDDENGSNDVVVPIKEYCYFGDKKVS